MGKRAPVQRTTEEKWEIAQGGSNRGIVSETRGQQGMAPRLFHRWKVSSRRIITLQLNHWLSIAGLIAVGWLHLLVIKTARVHSG